MNAMTKGERTDLASLVRQRAKSPPSERKPESDGYDANGTREAWTNLRIHRMFPKSTISGVIAKPITAQIASNSARAPVREYAPFNTIPRTRPAASRLRDTQPGSKPQRSKTND